MRTYEITQDQHRDFGATHCIECTKAIIGHVHVSSDGCEARCDECATCAYCGETAAMHLRIGRTCGNFPREQRGQVMAPTEQSYDQLRTIDDIGWRFTPEHAIASAVVSTPSSFGLYDPENTERCVWVHITAASGAFEGQSIWDSCAVSAELDSQRRRVGNRCGLGHFLANWMRLGREGGQS